MESIRDLNTKISLEALNVKEILYLCKKHSAMALCNDGKVEMFAPMEG